jgi:hypothetical protein
MAQSGGVHTIMYVEVDVGLSVRVLDGVKDGVKVEVEVGGIVLVLDGNLVSVEVIVGLDVGVLDEPLSLSINEMITIPMTIIKIARIPITVLGFISLS